VYHLREQFEVRSSILGQYRKISNVQAGHSKPKPKNLGGDVSVRLVISVTAPRFYLFKKSLTRHFDLFHSLQTNG
jgi:hypothetical protein